MTSPTQAPTRSGNARGKLNLFGRLCVVRRLSLHASKVCWIFYRLVEFADKEGMRYALDKLDGEELDGKKIRLVEEKRGGGRRSRSRSPPPRRSR